jgi:hypothetical protein
MKEVKEETYIDPETNILHITVADAGNDDWIRAARLQRKADAGDKTAAVKLKKLFDTPLYELEEKDYEELGLKD